MSNVVKVTEKEMKEMLPIWICDRIKNRCIHCESWNNECLADSMICYVSDVKEPNSYLFDREYHYTIRFWLSMKLIEIATEKNRR